MINVLWLAIVFVVALVCWLPAYRLTPAGERAALFVTLLGLSAIGTTAGVIGGLSRVGVAGEIIAAALGLLGGVVVYVFAADRTKGTVVSICAIAFSLSLFTGYFQAADRRANPESYLFWRTECLAKYVNKDTIENKSLFLIVDKSIGPICAAIFKNEKALLLDAK